MTVLAVFSSMIAITCIWLRYTVSDYPAMRTIFTLLALPYAPLFGDNEAWQVVSIMVAIFTIGICCLINLVGRELAEERAANLKSIVDKIQL